jgi:hypothetical protein
MLLCCALYCCIVTPSDHQSLDLLLHCHGGCGLLPPRTHTEWLTSGRLQQLVLVITNTITQEVVERWTFQVDTNTEVLHKG